MPIWTDFVDLVYASLLVISGAFGGNMGLAIGFLSIAFRLALLPLTLRMAYRSIDIQAALKKLQPKLSSIQKKYKDDPRRVWEETARLHQQHGIKLVDGRSLIGLLVQVPLFLGLFAAVQRGLSSSGRFLWIRDLMKPDPLLACICAVLTAVSGFLGSNATDQQRIVAFLLPALLTVFFLWRMTSGVVIYSFASGLVSLVQSLLVRRRLAKLAA
jgi:YidC/Oxa1 family membrane protein insertase